MQFTPLEDFVDEETETHYLVGFVYTLRPGNTRLAKSLSQWLREGQVKLVGAQASGRLVGRGESAQQN